jgi:ribosomal protein L19
MKKMPNLGDLVFVEFLGDGMYLQQFQGQCISVRWKGYASSFILTTKTGFQQKFLINSPLLLQIKILRYLKKK